MTDLAAPARSNIALERDRAMPVWLPWLALIALSTLAFGLRGQLPVLFTPPKAIVPLTQWLTDGWEWFVDAHVFYWYTFKDLTRTLSGVFNYPMQLLQVLLAPDFQRPQWLPEHFPSIPWLTLAGLAGIAGHYAGGWRIAALLLISTAYFAVFGMWNATGLTVASVLVAVPVGMMLGLIIGIQSFKHPRFRESITVLMDLMQTVPFFSYMVPVVVLFGISPVSGMVATVIFAMPPMVRVTDLALRSVPDELIDFGRMAGCKPWQVLWLVRLPAARETLMIGLNQVILMSLNLVILAAVIGAGGGLGFEVWNALNRLYIGRGLEYGMAIVILAVMLDRFLRALAAKRPESIKPGATLLQRNPYLIGSAVFLVARWALALAIPALAVWPREWTITTAPFWDAIMRFVIVNFFDYLNGFRDFVTLHIINNLHTVMKALPWPAVIAGLALAGYQLGGWRLALLPGLLMLAIAVAGLWDRTTQSVLEMAISVAICVAVGFPLGIWAARSARVWRILEPIADVLQTIPSFIFLLPFVMLFRTGVFTAILVVITFAIVPAIRYTAEGIRLVPHHLVEAARAAGCNEWQILREVQLPLALPSILLGLNQTIMMALSMLVITAYTGVPDLGLDTLSGVMKRDFGKSVLAGLAIAALAVISDRLIKAGVARMKLRMGLP